MKRLFDDPQLSAALRNDLQRSRAAAQEYPVSEKLLQLRAALSDSSRQPQGQDSSWTDVAGRSWQPWTLWHAGWKLLVIMAVAGSGAVGVQRMLSDADEVRPAVVVPLPAAEREVVEVQPPAAAEVAPPPVEPPRPSQPVLAVKAPAPSSSSRKEIAQLVRMRELLKKDPAAAYELSQRSEREFPAGLLSEERQALAILALVKTGATDDARRRANALFLRYPQTPMREQIEAALAR